MSENVGFAGQIAPEHVAQIVEKGFKSIVNNRPDLEGGAEQPTSAQIEEAARQAGLDYVYQPVVPGQITELDVRAFANHYNELHLAANPIVLTYPVQLYQKMQIFLHHHKNHIIHLY